jgi:hypothetical protein
MNTHISIYVSANDYIDSNIGTIFRYVPVDYGTIGTVLLLSYCIWFTYGSHTVLLMLLLMLTVLHTVLRLCNLRFVRRHLTYKVVDMQFTLCLYTSYVCYLLPLLFVLVSWFEHVKYIMFAMPLNACVCGQATPAFNLLVFQASKFVIKIDENPVWHLRYFLDSRAYLNHNDSDVLNNPLLVIITHHELITSFFQFILNTVSHGIIRYDTVHTGTVHTVLHFIEFLLEFRQDSAML